MGHRLGGYRRFWAYEGRVDHEGLDLRNAISSSLTPDYSIVGSRLPEPHLNHRPEESGQATAPSTVFRNRVRCQIESRFVMSEDPPTPISERKAFLPSWAEKVHRVERGAQCSVL